MSNTTTEEMVTITVDGREMQVPKGAMLIEVTDANHIHVPRFCYHKKLPVSANCRMCLVEVEKAPKPLPACATPVMDGMVVRTQSQIARDAQKSVMEFLLINHPLDCPICDQGGECELQDVAVAYGQDVSQYVESKRVVFDKNIGPLIATELTRCIHCTRCVRFGREIAGMRELGMTGRGENSLIATFVDECVNSEMSGNAIDVCPVGALTAKPSRFKGRAWEMVQHKTVAAHDCMGSNLFVHTLRGGIVRVVPRENEAINEVWLSDRDRFSYEGLEADDRLTTPMIKVDGQWRSADWDEALQLVADKFKAIVQLKAEQAAAAEAEKAEDDGKADTAETENEESSATEPANTEMAALVSPNATLEELYLAQKLLRGLGSGSIEHRLRQSDFSDENSAPVMPWLGQSIEQLEQLDAALLIGSNVRKEQPIANLRLRKAAVNNGAKVSFLNPRRYEFNYPVANNLVVAAQDMAAGLAAIASAVFTETGNAAPSAVSAAVAAVKVEDEHRAVAKNLLAGENSTVILGNIAAMHPQFSALRTLADAIAKATGSRLAYLSDGANAAGAWLAGAVPHRGAGGQSEDVLTGDNLAQITEQQLAACLLLNIEPDTDAADAAALMATLKAAGFVVSLSTYNSASVKQVADVMLPTAAFTESSGTFVNAEGYWQSFNAVVEAPGISRPAWKILRVLCNLCGLEGFDYISSKDIKDELRAACESLELSNAVENPAMVELRASEGLQRAADVPMYAADALVRRATALQQTIDAQTLCARINARAADLLDLTGAETVVVRQGEHSTTMPLVIDDSIPDHCVWIATALQGNDKLGPAFAAVSIESAG